MNTEQILAEIREANLSYLMLAQSLIRSDKEQALFRLGVSEETANLIGALTPAQMMKVATGNTLLCRFRMDDDMVWNLLTNHGFHPDGRPPPGSSVSHCCQPDTKNTQDGEHTMARSKSILTEARQIERAVTLINLGARLQVLESETDLSYERLLRLYKEVAGKSPSKGQLPFSTDWFMTWQPNIHSSLFLNMHEYLNKTAALDEIDTVIKAYQLYLEQMQAQGLEPLLSVTRAWRLVKFVDNGMLTMTACSKCGGHFVTHPHEIARHYVCGLCNPPARAGKGKLAGSLGAEYSSAHAH
jgi:flagellar transcriptional activator FlhC